MHVPSGVIEVAKARWAVFRDPSAAHVDIQHFLAATESLLPIFDALGFSVLSIAKNDIRGNMQKLQNAHTQSGLAGSRDLWQLLAHETRLPGGPPHNGGVSSVLWLRRAFDFIYVFLEGVRTRNEKLRHSASHAYDRTLARFHGGVVRTTVSLAMKALTSREKFLGALGSDERAVLQDIAEFLVPFRSLIAGIEHFYRSHGLECDESVL
eukprot:tig00021127_g18703.t1